MSAEAALFIAGSVPLVLAGGAHAVYGLVDVARPTYFAPLDPSATSAMKASGIGLRRGAPGGAQAPPSVWSVWVGVHIGFGVGIMMFGVLCLAIALHDFDVVEQVTAIRPLALAFSAAFFALSLRFFFHIPALITGVSTACFAVALALAA